jgi:hypothetical protein
MRELGSIQIQTVAAAVRRIQEAPNGSKATLINLCHLVYLRVFESNNQTRLNLMKDLMTASLTGMKRGELVLDTPEQIQVVVNTLMRLYGNLEAIDVRPLIGWLSLIGPEASAKALMHLLETAERSNQLSDALKTLAKLAPYLKEVVNFRPEDLHIIMGYAKTSKAAVDEILAEIYHGKQHAALKGDPELRGVMNQGQPVQSENIPPVATPRPFPSVSAVESVHVQNTPKTILQIVEEFLGTDPHIFKPDRIDYAHPMEVTPLLSVVDLITKQEGLLSNSQLPQAIHLIDRLLSWYVDLHFLRSSDARFTLGNVIEPSGTIAKALQGCLQQRMPSNDLPSTLRALLQCYHNCNQDETSVFRRKIMDALRRLLKKWTQRLTSEAKRADFSAVLQVLSTFWPVIAGPGRGEVLDDLGGLVDTIIAANPTKLRQVLDTAPLDPGFLRFCDQKLGETMMRALRSQQKSFELLDSAVSKVEPETSPAVKPVLEEPSSQRKTLLEARRNLRRSRVIDAGSPSKVSPTERLGETPPRLAVEVASGGQGSLDNRMLHVEGERDRSSALAGFQSVRPDPEIPASRGGGAMVPPSILAGIHQKPIELKSTWTLREDATKAEGRRVSMARTGNGSRQSSAIKPQGFGRRSVVAQGNTGAQSTSQGKPETEQKLRKVGVEELLDMLKKGNFSMNALDETFQADNK